MSHDRLNGVNDRWEAFLLTEDGKDYAKMKESHGFKIPVIEELPQGWVIADRSPNETYWVYMHSDSYKELAVEHHTDSPMWAGGLQRTTYFIDAG